MIKRGLNWIKDLLYPVFCINCRQEGEWWCDNCLKEKLHEESYFTDGAIKSVTSFFVYEAEGEIGKLIKQFKYHSAHDLKSLWKKVLLNFQVAEGTVIVPVPLYRRRARQRGYNQAEILAEIIAKNNGTQVYKHLKRIKNTAQQAKLEKEERLKNVAGAFVWEGGEIYEPVLLVDDVWTTGATMETCAEVLAKNGAKNIQAFVLARAIH